jgi:hypothetical protein
MPVFIFRCFLTVLCMPFVFVVLRLCLLGTTVNEPLVGWRRAFVRAFLMYWSHILLHIGFNIWPRITGGLSPTLAPASAGLLASLHLPEDSVELCLPYTFL